MVDNFYNCTIVFNDNTKNHNCKLTMKHITNLRQVDCVMNIIIKNKVN